MRNRSFLTSPFTRTAKVCTPSASATSRNMGCPDTGGTPAMTCTFMPDIPSQENLGSGGAGVQLSWSAAFPRAMQSQRSQMMMMEPPTDPIASERTRTRMQQLQHKEKQKALLTNMGL